MADNFQNKEYYEGIWNGENVKFNRCYSGYRFTDDECSRLINGETIEIDGLVSAKTGKKYGVRGKLSRQTYEGHEYVGFERLGFLEREFGIPDEYMSHVFSSSEKEKLLNGEEIRVSDFVSPRIGTKFGCQVSWGQRNDNRVGFIFKYDN